MSAAPGSARPSPGPSQRGRDVAPSLPGSQPARSLWAGGWPRGQPCAQRARCPSGLQCRKRGLFGEVELGDHAFPKLAVFLLPLGSSVLAGRASAEVRQESVSGG